jgi:hypothetical protein
MIFTGGVFVTLLVESTDPPLIPDDLRRRPDLVPAHVCRGWAGRVGPEA